MLKEMNRNRGQYPLLLCSPNCILLLLPVKLCKTNGVKSVPGKAVVFFFSLFVRTFHWNVLQINEPGSVQYGLMGAGTCMGDHKVQYGFTAY